MFNISFITATSFIFNKKNSDDYNLMIAWIDTNDIDVSENGLNMELKKTNYKTNSLYNVYGIETENPIIFNFGIVKRDTSEITRLQSMQINEWLTSSSIPQLLIFNDCDEYQLHYYAVCTQIEDVIVGGKLIGKNIKLETNSSYAFAPKIEKIVEVKNSCIFHINNTYKSIIFPLITIVASSTSIVIENITDKKSVTINTVDINSESDGTKYLKLNSCNMTVLDKSNKLIPAYKLGWGDTYKSYSSSIDDYIQNIYWIKFIKGINEIKVTGTCEITIEYEPPRKAGCL